MNFLSFNNLRRADIAAIQEQMAMHAHGLYDEGKRGNALRAALSPAVGDYLVAMTRLYAHDEGKVPSAKERATVKAWVFSELLDNLSKSKGYSHKAARRVTFDAFNRLERPDILRIQTQMAHNAQGEYGAGKRGEALRRAIAPSVDQYLSVMAAKYAEETGRSPTAKERATVKGYVFRSLNKNLATHYGYDAAKAKRAPKARPNHHGGYHAPGDPLGYERENGARRPARQGQSAKARKGKPSPAKGSKRGRR